MDTQPSLITRFVVGVDMQSYSRRTTRVQEILRRELSELLHGAAATAGLDAATWELFDTGDGKLAVLPPDVDLASVVGRFVDDLDARLVERNGDRSDTAQLRLRVAMHSDGLVASPPGYAGPALVVLSRYLDSQPVRDALKSAGRAGLALILSDVVHRMVVQAEMGGLRPDRYRHVDVSIPSKSFRSSGYVHVPGYDMSTFAALGPASRGEPPSPAPTASARGPAAPGGGTVGISIGSITTNSGRVPVTYGDYVEGSKHDSGRSDG